MVPVYAWSQYAAADMASTPTRPRKALQNRSNLLIVEGRAETAMSRMMSTAYSCASTSAVSTYASKNVDPSGNDTRSRSIAHPS